MPKTNNIEIKLAENKKELNQIFRIREIVFIKEQNVPKGIEMDEFDTTSKHFIVLHNTKPIGCARIRFTNKKAKLERIAILKKYRGKGFGKILMDYLIDYYEDNDATDIFMNSQFYLKDYYKKFGFEPRGKTFMEASIKHIEMHKR